MPGAVASKAADKVRLYRIISSNVRPPLPINNKEVMQMYKKLTADISAITKSKTNLSLLEIFISLEKFRLNMNLYTRRPKTRSKLFPHESPISLLMSVGSLYEALNSYDNIKKEARLTIVESKNTNALESFNWLSTKVVRSFKEKTLNILRNKGAFHIDTEVIEGYFNEDLDTTVVDIWKQDTDIPGHSPVAADILAWWTLNSLLDGDPLDNVTLLGDIYNHLLLVTSFLSLKWFEGSLE
ncbi:hypothetical protein D3C71_1207790 [compost metagenome]